jgi:transposase
LLVRSRDALVRARTMLVNSVRGLLKAVGERLPSCQPTTLPKKLSQIPAELQAAAKPLVDQIEHLSIEIAGLDEAIDNLVDEKYPECKVLTAVPGIGNLTALAFVLTLEDPGRFRRSRQVGAFLGLRPKQRQSGDSNPQLRISKTGDEYLRRLLVGSANHILRKKGEDSDLRRWGLSLAARGGKAARARAKVAVARKLAVLLHHLWLTGEVYQPLGYRKINAAA